MGKEIKPAQLKLSEAIAARRINLWGRQPGSLQIEQISNALFSPSKYKVIVTIHGELSTEPSHKRHKFEEEYKNDSKWYDIIFDEDEIRREWLPAGRAASAHESAEVTEESMPEPEPVSDGELEPGASAPPTPEPPEPESPLERPLEAESVKPVPATTEESPAAEPAGLVSIKARRQAQATKRKARRKAKKNSRITAAAAWAKNKSNLSYAEVRERQPGKVDFYTECKAAVPGLTYNEFRAGLKIERNRRRVEAVAAARKS